MSRHSECFSGELNGVKQRNNVSQIVKRCIYKIFRFKRIVSADNDAQTISILDRDDNICKQGNYCGFCIGLSYPEAIESAVVIEEVKGAISL